MPAGQGNVHIIQNAIYLVVFNVPSGMHYRCRWRTKAQRYGRNVER